MTWRDIGALIKPLAPTLGTLLGGPLGGIAGAVLGSALGLGSGGGASALTPEVVQAAIEKGGDAVLEAIKAAENEASAKWGYLTEGLKDDAIQAQAINETMRAEIGHIGFWHWRNLIGYVIVAWAVVPIPFVTYSVARGETVQIQATLNLASTLLPYFTILAGLCGFVAMDNTRRTTSALLGEHAPTILGSITKAITKR